MDQKYQIVVCHRGWVFVGVVTEDEKEVVISNASNIRRWGTSEGLGELALKGPLEETVLDKAGTVRVHPLSIVCRFDCDLGAWVNAG